MTGKRKRTIPHIIRWTGEIRDTTMRPMDELGGTNSNDWLVTAYCGSHTKSHDLTRHYTGRHCPGIMFYVNNSVIKMDIHVIVYSCC